MKLRPFELALVVGFGILMVASLIILRSWKPEPKETVVLLNGAVTIWGTIPEESFNTVIREIANTQPAYDSVSYFYISPETFDETFINALADGVGPDLLLLSHESLVKHRSRIEAVPYESFPARDFRSLYVDGAEIFALSDGIYGYPILVDPLMMYWNRDLFAFSNLINPPASWEELVSDVVPVLTTRDFERNITQSSLAMGEYKNVKNAFSIISMLLLQGGSAMVTENNQNYEIKLDQSLANDSSKRPFTTAMTFYTSFNTVSNSLYSWNRSLSLDRDQFLQDRLAIYFGFGSEARELESGNPNLSFDIAPVPQSASATVKRTYARFYGLMVPRFAQNKIGAYAVRQELSSQANTKKLADAYNLAPTYRSSLTAGSNDIYGRVIYDSVPHARGWLNPDRVQTDSVLERMLEDVSSNRSEVSYAARDVVGRLEQVY